VTTAIAKLPAIAQSTRPVPVQYSKAIKAIAACRSFDEARDWSDKADALAAWSKIYRDDKIGREAKALKLHAYRRMGQLAAALRPRKGTGRGSVGAQSLLEEEGFSKSRASSIVKIGKMEEEPFQAIANSSKPPSPSVLVHQKLRPNPEWASFSHRMSMFLSGMRQASPRDVAANLSDREAQAALKQCREMLFWLVPFHDDLKARIPAMKEQT
jgi:hypothetical protein